VFITVVLSILVTLNLAWAFGAWCVQRRGAARGMWRAITIAFVLLQLAGLGLVISWRFGSPQSGGLVQQSLTAAIFLWHLILLPIFVSLLWLLLGGWAVIGIGRWAINRKRRRVPDPADGGVGRREFLGAALATVPPLLTLGTAATAAAQLSHFRVRRLAVNLPTLPAALEGTTIAHLSDFHVGPFTAGEVLEEIVEVTNQLGTDLAIFTGDLINTSLGDLPEALSMLKQISARNGLYVIEGNHDLIDDGREFERRVRGAGLNLLQNEQAQIQVAGVPVQLLGLRWGGGQRAASRTEEHGDRAIEASMRELLALREPAAFSMLLAHHPHAFDAAAAAGIPLTLAGHTHGGQLMLNERMGFGPVLFRYWTGLYEKGASRLVVSNGTGNWFPLRTSAPAEILHLTLQRGG
jgi:predicted MPP superfamily phosphohydrolase